MWRQLRHPHLHEFLGLDMLSFDSTAIVSPWMENGNLLQFVKKKPDAERLRLVRVSIVPHVKLHSSNEGILAT